MKNLMSYLWDNVPKTADGDVLLTAYDLEWLWGCGFVDTERVSLAKWVAHFEPHRLNDDQFQLNQAAFLALDPLRYKGPIHQPFNAKMINEGKYTDEGLQELFLRGVSPSVRVGPNDLARFVSDFKTAFRDPSDKLIAMTPTGKTLIGEWIEKNPSPLRRLEQILDQMVQQREAGSPMATTADAVAAVELKAFTMLPSNEAVAKREALDKLTQSKKEKPEVDPGKGTPLHKLKRNTKGVRG